MRYELRKIVNKRIVIVIVFAAILINGINSMNIVNRNNSLITDKQAEGMERIYNKVEGRITAEKIDYICQEYERLDAVVRNRDYSTEYDENTYTGYIYSDYTLFMELYEDILYAGRYSENSKKIVEKAQEAEKVFGDKNNKYMVGYNQKIIKLYGGRAITNYYSTTEGWKKYFNYQFSNLIVVCLIIFLNAALFAGEREERMSVILLTSRKGRKKTFINKIAAGMLVSLLVSTIVYLEDFITFYFGFGLKGGTNPIYSLREWEMCPLDISILEFALLVYCLRMVGVLTMTALVMLSSGIANNSLWASVISVVFIIAAVVINNLKLPYDFLYLLSVQVNLQNYQVNRVINIPFLKVEAVTIICIAAIIIMLLIAYIFETKWKLIQRRERV